MCVVCESGDLGVACVEGGDSTMVAACGVAGAAAVRETGRCEGAAGDAYARASLHLILVYMQHLYIFLPEST